MATRAETANGSSSVSISLPGHAFQKMWRDAGLFLVLCTASPAFGSDRTPQPHFLGIQGQRYPNACMASQTADLKRMLFAGQAPDAMQAWHVIDLILCAPISHANQLAVKNSIKGRVERLIESTGDKQVQKYVGASEALARQAMAGGQAWNAHIEVEARTIALEYYSNEACIRTVKLEYTGAAWTLSELADACD